MSDLHAVARAARRALEARLRGEMLGIRLAADARSLEMRVALVMAFADSYAAAVGRAEIEAQAAALGQPTRDER